MLKIENIECWLNDQYEEQIRKNNIEFRSLLTFMVPKERKAIDVVEIIKKFFKNFKKVHTSAKYLYCLELTSDGKIHVHAVTDIDLSMEFYAWKRRWAAYFDIVSNSGQTTFLDYKGIKEGEGKNVYFYLFKNIISGNLPELRSIKSVLTNKEYDHIYGGSREFSESLYHIVNRLVNSLLQNIEDIELKYKEFVTSNTLLQNIFLSLNDEKYIEHHKNKTPFFNEIKIYQQLYNEMTHYTEKIISACDFQKIESLVPDKNNNLPYVKYLQCLKKLASRFNSKFFNELEKYFIIMVDLKELKPWYLCNILHILLYDAHRSANYFETSKRLLVYFKELKLKFKRINPSTDKDEVAFALKASYFFIICLNNIFNENGRQLIRFDVECDKGLVDVNIEQSLTSNDFKDTEIIYYLRVSHLSVVFDLDPLYFQNMLYSLQAYLSSIICFTLPMLVPPKRWVPQHNVKEIEGKTSWHIERDKLEQWKRQSIEQKLLYTTQCNYTGGLLSNNQLFKRSLCKTLFFAEHKQHVSEQWFISINKIQETAFCINKAMFRYLNTPEINSLIFLSAEQRLELKVKLNALREELVILYKKKSDLKIGFSLEEERILLNKKAERNAIVEKLSVDELYCRILKGYQNIADSVFYFNMELDWRGRIYPMASEFHPMGNKLSRSLVRFAEESLFNLTSFKLGAIRSYYKSYKKSEVELLYLWPEVEDIMLFFRKKKAFIKAQEPLMFLSYCFEYERFINFKNKYPSKVNEYKTGFIIYLDATASGCQNITLLYSLDIYKNFVNLVKQTEHDIVGDFYIGIITQFLTKQNCIIHDKYNNLPESEKIVLLGYLRKVFKQDIMTQFYGVSYQRFYKQAFDELLQLSEKITALVGAFDVKLLINDFWYFLKSCDLYQLKDLLKAVISLIGENALIWTISDKLLIEMFYKKLQVKSLDIKPQKKDNSLVKYNRKQIVYYKSLPKLDVRKQNNAAMANFIHSLDAYVLMTIIGNSNFPIVPIHDCFGVPMNSVPQLVNLIKTVYSEIMENHSCYNQLFQTFCELIKTLSKNEQQANASIEILKHCARFGNLTTGDIKESRYLVWY